MEINTIFVAGAGTMGGGISQICAQAGYKVKMYDLSYEIIERSLTTMKWSLSRLIDKGKVKKPLDEIIANLETTTDLKMASEADIVFEAIVEDVKAKRTLFFELDEICPGHSIFATNTSAIPITEISETLKRKDKILGTHFFNPVPIMQIVEIVRGLLTSEEALELAEKLCKTLGKETIRVNQDVAGFALNRINFPSTVEAIKLVEAGIVSVEDVDKGMRLGYGRPMGPFETGDLTGLDVTFNALKAVYNETQNEKFFPPMLLQRKVSLGQLGRKVGIGWYKYDEDGRKIGAAKLY